MNSCLTSNISNVSLVAFYGEKPVGLSDLITELQTYLANHRLLRNKFVPYQNEQVHGTIIGCEGFKSGKNIVSKWFKERRNETKCINFSGLTDYLRQPTYLPITIRFGGYNRLINYDFLSRDEHLYDRSFQLQSAEEQTIPVLIGWSWSNDAVTLAIDKLRRDFQQFGLLHKYHTNSSSVDNDFYLRLGTIEARLSPAEKKAIAFDLCQILAANNIHVPIKLNNLAFVQYQDLQLTPATTKVIPLDLITDSKLQWLYQI